MRTIEEIKKSITEAWMKDKTLAAAYGFSEGSDWPFSKVSIENTLCYIVAAAIWTHERLFDAHQTEVETIIAQKKPHSLRWYVDKVKQFRAGVPLADDSDEYADGMTDDEIEASQVVKFAAANESSGTVYIKVATESNGTKSPLTAEQVEGLKEYIAEVKDAGVRVEVINQPACRLRLQLDIHYNPMVLDGSGNNISTGVNPVEAAIEAYIGNLPFNGEYRNSALVDALQAVDGVVIPELTAATESYDGVTWTAINAKAQPYSGYYRYDATGSTINYIPYVSANN